MKMFRVGVKLSLLFFATMGIASADHSEQVLITKDHQVKTFLNRFHQDPFTVMNEQVVKKNSNGQVLSQKVLTEAQQELLAKRRYQLRNHMIEKDQFDYPDIGVGVFSAYLEDDLAEDFVFNPSSMERNIFEMDKAKLTEGKLVERPWSDDYWPIYKGQLGFRYADPKANASVGFIRTIWDTIWGSDSAWYAFHKYVQKNPASDYIKNNKSHMLSPSEKYDLLIDDKNFQLTNKMWQEGEEYYNTNWKVETWMGICHGWAAASYMVPRPLHPVSVTTANTKHKIIFYPADIKALISLFWANFDFRAKFIGGRCNVKSEEIKKDPENGRILNRECFDTNPGSWHMSVVNQMGINKKSFIIDANYDYEVWNQPVVSYKYSYFNPQTFETYPDATSAAIALKDYSNDKFARFRAPNAKKVVGVVMNITYASETSPMQGNDDPSMDNLIKVTYYYDLELDDQGDILGGEWYVNAHPDFLWTPEMDVKPYIALDKTIKNQWNPTKEALPKEWATTALRASESKLPLGRILYALLAASRGSNSFFEDL
ncbi:MAG: hypothetical protein HQK50_00885 [Oligoflexia bacterium]|nr:hypothetical protein [Oligoflexia bacterium]